MILLLQRGRRLILFQIKSITVDAQVRAKLGCNLLCRTCLQDTQILQLRKKGLAAK